MNDTYTLFNGRGYPDTVDPNPIANIEGHNSQNTSSLIEAAQGQKILLRISSLATVDFYTVTLLGMQMKVVGQGARLLRGPDGKNLYYDTSSITIGGGEAMDVIIDTTGVTPGTYFLYTANLNQLSNDAEDFGGMMTEIVIN
jgi:FtsP/CotA-like multicopper oxidase with cupredoxin domain